LNEFEWISSFNLNEFNEEDEEDGGDGGDGGEDDGVLRNRDREIAVERR